MEVRIDVEGCVCDEDGACMYHLDYAFEMVQEIRHLRKLVANLENRLIYLESSK